MELAIKKKLSFKEIVIIWMKHYIWLVEIIIAKTTHCAQVFLLRSETLISTRKP